MKLKLFGRVELLGSNGWRSRWNPTYEWLVDLPLGFHPVLQTMRHIKQSQDLFSSKIKQIVQVLALN